MAKIGDAVAIIQGTTERPASSRCARPTSSSMSSGVVEPRAILVIDGKSAPLHAVPESAQRAARDHDVRPRTLSRATRRRRPPGSKACWRATSSRRSSTRFARRAAPSTRRIRPEVLGCASASDPAALARATKNDPWDGRISREEAFIAAPEDRHRRNRRSRTWTRFSTNCAASRARGRSRFCARPRGSPGWALSRRCATPGPE